MDRNLDPFSSDDLPEAATAKRPRTVLLVARPLDTNMNHILSKLGANIARLTPPLSDWNPTAAPPRMSENLCFARHMAICIVSSEIWSDGARDFKDRFSSGRFWEHVGSWLTASTAAAGQHGIPGSCARWNDAQIESIESAEILGTTKLSNEEISTGGKRRLGRLGSHYSVVDH